MPRSSSATDDSDFGDLPFNFDPDSFSRNLRRNLDLDTYRAGLRYSPMPTSDFLVSLIYGDAEEDRKLRDSLIPSSGVKRRIRAFRARRSTSIGQDRFNFTTRPGL